MDSKAYQVSQSDFFSEPILQRLQELAHQKAFLELILTSAGDGICGLDTRGLTTFVNPAAASMLGYGVDELLGKPLHHLIHRPTPEGGACECSSFATLREGMTLRIVGERFSRKDGTCFPVEGVVAPIVGNEALAGMVLTFKDITERQQIEQLKDQFFANMSHELRTPLNSIIGFAEDTLDGIVGELNDAQYRYVENIATAGQHLLKLINGILDFTKLRSGKAHSSQLEFSFHEALVRLERTVAPFVARKAQRLVFEVPPELPPLYGDPDHLYQALLNLVDNAHKFTPRGGRILIQARQEEDHLRVVVLDNGMGIPSEALPLIFQEFRQVDLMRKPRHQGTGLGLAITKQLIDGLGGQISVQSKLNEGSAFSFTLPLVGRLP